MHRRFTLFSVTLAIVVIVAAGISVNARERGEATGATVETKPYFAMSGPNSAIDYRAFAVIRDQETFDLMWQKHKGDGIERAGQGWPLSPDVDFDSCMVVALFRGDSVNCNGEQIESIHEHEDHLEVRYDSVTYQTASFDGKDRGNAVTPYGIFVVPRVDKKVHLVENVQGFIGQPPKWERQAIISYPHAKGGWFVPGAFGAQDTSGR